jgi:moderate conductance mechanosensitive channel
MPEFLTGVAVWQRIGLVLFAAVAAHILVRVIRAASTRAMSSDMARHINKTRTVVSLVSSTLIFALYFSAIGFALSEFGVPVTTYFASASIIGLAVAFGSQGLVQDVVSGLTVVFTDLVDIGDMVEITGQVGVVERFGMRFIVLRNPLGAEVFVPNRNIANVVVYPRGYVRCLVDVSLPSDAAVADLIEEMARSFTDSAREQYPGILRAPPEMTGRFRTQSGKTYLRIKFRIWPGRGAPLESLFQKEMLQSVKRSVPDYADWMISVNYEVERYTPPAPRRSRQS